MYIAESLPWYQALFFNSVAVFVIFTPLHDATHGSVAKDKSVNNAIGWLSSVPFLAPFPLFKWIHLHHHKYSNDRIMDPDHFAGVGPTLLLPLRWAFGILWYFHWTISYVLHQRDHPGGYDKPTRVVVSQCPRVFVGAICSLVLLSFKFHEAVLVCWVAPTFLASAYLMYVFDYIPHRPHKISEKENPYKATSITFGLFSVSELDLVLLYQNYHLIHHLFPSIPFYRMGSVYWKHRDTIQKYGGREVPLVDWANASHQEWNCSSNHHPRCR